MPDQRLSVHDRVTAISHLEKLARELNLMSAWLAEHDMETEADAIDVAAKNLLTCCWWLDRPMRPQLPPQRWTEPAQQFQ